MGDGQARTLTAQARNTAGYLDLLQDVEAANPQGGDLYWVTANSSFTRVVPFDNGWQTIHGSIRRSFPPTLTD